MFGKKVQENSIIKLVKPVKHNAKPAVNASSYRSPALFAVFL